MTLLKNTTDLSVLFALCCATFVLLSSFFLWKSSSLDVGTWILPGPRIVPVAVCALMLMVSGGLLVNALTSMRIPALKIVDPDDANSGSEGVAASVWLSLLTYPVTVVYLGHMISMAIVILIVLLALRTPTMKSVLTAALCAVASQYIFGRLLLVPLPTGSWL